MADFTNLVLSFSQNKCLWGNIPAIDVLQLQSNEGVGYGKQMKLLFAGMPSTPSYYDEPPN